MGMDKNEYFSNSYKAIITNKFFHLIIILIEYFLTLSFQIIIFIRKFNINSEETLSILRYQIIIIEGINKIRDIIKIVIILFFCIIIHIYYFIFNKFLFKKNNIFSRIIINTFEIFLLRLFFILICHIIFSSTNLSLLICIIISIPIVTIIIKNIKVNHLYYYAPHFLSHPYDYYTAFCDIIHLVEKILIVMCLENSRTNLNKFLFIIVFFFQIISFLVSFYIFYYKSFWVMNNIFLNKARFSLIFSTILINIIMILLGNCNNKYIFYFFHYYTSIL